ncbi:MAG: response regulator [Atopobiaceae bacterium]|nr:response regulator [Atopobiaceae bacterium]
MRILAVDDKAVPRRALVRVIQAAVPDAQITACASASEVIALPDVETYDVAFVDIDMPGKSGIQLARELKSVHPSLNIIFATGYGEYMADAFELHSSGYLMKPILAEDIVEELENLRYPLANELPDRVIMRCFGNFEVFLDGRPIVFERAKTKELLAYLIDRRGSVVSLREIEAVLWREQSEERPSRSYLRTLVADLRHTFDACGHGDVIRKYYGEIGIDAKRVFCDYYDFIEGDPRAIASWNGEYMSQYAWAEPTKAYLTKLLLQPGL